MPDFCPISKLRTSLPNESYKSNGQGIILVLDSQQMIKIMYIHRGKIIKLRVNLSSNSYYIQ